MAKILIFFFLSTPIYSLGKNLNKLIEKPIASRRCQALLKDRNEKIIVKQRLNALVMRSEKLIKKAKKSQKLGSGKLQYTQIKLKNQLRFTNLRIKAMEEDIVRKGCPGIVL